jgi:phosphopentomutase
VAQTDRRLGGILRTIDTHARLRSHLLVVLTADHGTHATSHRDRHDPANYRVPFVAWGPGVSRGADLYELNPELADPGTGQPAYSGAQPIHNADAANLVLDVLDLPRVPGSEFNRLRTLDLG